jgi:hypothetical protein
MPDRIGPSRRDFLKLVGASLGGVMLTSCAGGGGGTVSGGGGSGNSATAAPTPLPNGYQFYRLFTVGDRALPDVATVAPLVMMDGAGHVLFYSQDARGATSLKSLSVDYGGGRPSVIGARTLATVGQKIGDGRVISSLGSVDVDAQGRVALVLNFDTTVGPPGQGPCAVAMERGEGLETFLDYGDEVGGNNGLFGGDFGDLDIHDGSLLLVARYGGGGETAQGVVYVPASTLSGSQVVLSSSDQMPNADGAINGLGLIDLDDDGEFVAQAFGTTPFPLKAQEEAPPFETAVIRGNVSHPTEARLLAASKGLKTSRALAASPPPVGSSLYGPRIAANGITSNIIEDGSGVLTLYRNGEAIAATGQASPGGSFIRGLVPAVINPSGLTFYELATDAGLELCLHNGSRSALLLSRGAALDDQVVDTIMYGFHTAQADPAGRIVGYVQTANGQESVLLGIPV